MKLRAMEQSAVGLLIYFLGALGRALQKSESTPWYLAVVGCGVVMAIWFYWRSSRGIDVFLTTAVQNVEDLEKALEKPKETEDEAKAA